MTQTARLRLTPERRRQVVLGLLLLATFGAGLSLCAGPSGLDLGPIRLLQALFGASSDGLIVVRTMRVALAVVVGIALCTSGATLQALLRNPLADPFIIGVSGAAALGGAMAVALAQSVHPLVVVAASVGGALLATGALAWVLMRPTLADGATTALLVGVVINGFAAALITLIKTLVSAAKAQALLFWLVGTVGYPSATALVVTAVVVAGATALLLSQAGHLEILRTGDAEAMRLGVDVKRTRLIAYVAASALVGAVVPLTGLIGFVGLVLPHAFRLLWGADMRLHLAASALGGAFVLPLFDAAARCSFAWLDTEVPVGALTALIGAPVFIALLLRRGGLQ